MKFQIETDNRIKHCTARESARYSMRSPMVRIRDGVGVIAATDGRTAAVRPVQVLNGTRDGDVLLGADTLGKNPTQNPKRFRVETDTPTPPGHHPDVDTRDGGGDPITAHELDRRGESKAARITRADLGTLPPLADVFPSREQRRYAAITVNPDLMAAALKAAQSDDPDQQGVTIYVEIVAPEQESGISHISRGCRDRSRTPFVCVGHGEGAGAAIGMPINCDEDTNQTFDRGRELFARMK